MKYSHSRIETGLSLGCLEQLTNELIAYPGELNDCIDWEVWQGFDLLTGF